MKLFKNGYHLLKSLFHFFLNCIYSVIFYKNIKVYFCNHLTIGLRYLHKKRVVFPHPVGIVIGMKVRIGFNCIIYQNVTIGTKDTQNFKTASYPQIGNNVIIYANSIIFGEIKIGDNCIIGAGSLITKDVPDNTIIAGNPAKIISTRSQI